MGSGLCCGNWTGSPTGLHQSPQVSNPSYHNEFGTWHSGYVGAEDSPTSRQLPQRTLSVHGDCNFPHTLSPWENGYIDSFNGKLRDELLNGELFDTFLEAQVLVERWRRHYNAVRPHSSLGYRPPAPETVLPWTESMALSHQMVPMGVT